MWTYSQSSGQLSDATGEVRGNGYSGNGPGLNNPRMQQEHNRGPIPQGVWHMGGFFKDQLKGPVVTFLHPDGNTETFDRTGFMIHGDNEAMDHTASDGCIILSRELREMIAASGDTTLAVVS